MKIQEKTKLHAHFHELGMAYGRVFDPKGVFTDLVMADLAEFCRANKSCFHIDPRAHALAEGRREVWLRIQDFLSLNADQLLEKYTRPVSVPAPENPKP